MENKSAEDRERTVSKNFQRRNWSTEFTSSDWLVIIIGMGKYSMCRNPAINDSENEKF